MNLISKKKIKENNIGKHLKSGSDPSRIYVHFIDIYEKNYIYKRVK